MLQVAEGQWILISSRASACSASKSTADEAISAQPVLHNPNG